MMKVKIHRMKIDVPSESSRFPFVIPIIKYPIKLHPATVRAYIICVETWVRWFTPAPALERIVVSDIGEQ